MESVLITMLTSQFKLQELVVGEKKKMNQSKRGNMEA